MNIPDLAVQALALTARHLKGFGFERILCSGASLRPFATKTEMILSANALQQLEVIVNYTFCFLRGVSKHEPILYFYAGCKDVSIFSISLQVDN